MDSADQLTLETVLAWLAAGRRAALVTVAATWGSAPRPPGAWAAIRDDGAVVGSVSGGCVEEDLIARMAAGEFAAGVRVLRYGGSPEEAARFGLPCGGTLELVVEGDPDRRGLERLHEHVISRRVTARTVDLASGRVALENAALGDACTWDGKCLTTIYGPRLRLLLIGAGQVSLHLARLAQVLDYEVYVCDPREEYRAGWNVPGTELLSGMPDDVVKELLPDPRLAVVALTHDSKLDDLALLEALDSPAFYVGALGSRASNRRRRERLAEHFAVGEAALARLRGPVGLAIGSHTPPEIAVSILAEMTAAKNGVPLAAQTDRAPVGERTACPG